MNNVKSEDIPEYNIAKRKLEQNEIISMALNIISTRLERSEDVIISNPDDVKKYLTLKLAEREREVFSVLFLDNGHRFIAYEELFKGTVNGATVHVREVVKRALELNAVALVLAHNHPSGRPDPSSADRGITDRLSEACALLDIRVLDHIIVGSVNTISFSERGYI